MKNYILNFFLCVRNCCKVSDSFIFIKFFFVNKFLYVCGILFLR